MPALKGTEASLSYVHHLLYLVSSSINVSIFLIIWLDAFWSVGVCIYPHTLYIMLHYTHVSLTLSLRSSALSIFKETQIP